VLGIKILVTKFADRVKGNLILRYGNSTSVNNTNELDINSPEFIRLLVNKKKFSGVLLENNIKTPQYTQLNNSFPDDLPVMLRSTLTGCKGIGIKVINNIEDLMKEPVSSYWTKFYNFTSEYRIHVVENKIIKVFRKILKEGEQKEEFPIRTSKKYKFSYVDYEEQFKKGKYIRLTEIVDKTCKVLDGKFLALDIGYDEKESYIIIEGNSAPGLNKKTAKEYTKNLILCLKPKL